MEGRRKCRDQSKWRASGSFSLRLLIGLVIVIIRLLLDALCQVGSALLPNWSHYCAALFPFHFRFVNSQLFWNCENWECLFIQWARVFSEQSVYARSQHSIVGVQREIANIGNKSWWWTTNFVFLTLAERSLARPLQPFFSSICSSYLFALKHLLTLSLARCSSYLGKLSGNIKRRDQLARSIPWVGL